MDFSVTELLMNFLNVSDLDFESIVLTKCLHWIKIMLVGLLYL